MLFVKKVTLTLTLYDYGIGFGPQQIREADRFLAGSGR